jgi:serine/threonine protein kinase
MIVKRMCSVLELSCIYCFFIRLTGCSTFSGQNYNEVVSKNKHCKINWNFEKINIILSPEGLDLLKKMLEKDPNKRITIEQTFKHPWTTRHMSQE